MKKIYLGLLLFLMAFFVLTGCASTEQTTEGTQSGQTEENEAGTEPEEEQTPETEQEETAAITISENNQEQIIAEEEVPVQEGDILFDVMEENFNIEATEDGFITAIEGVSQNEEEGKYWMYFVNGEMAEVGAKDYELQPGDEISFDLQAME